MKTRLKKEEEEGEMGGEREEEDEVEGEGKEAGEGSKRISACRL